jgi:ribosomal protein S18 acetylase RimI-like enzyme
MNSSAPKILPLSSFSFNELYSAHLKAFKDYPFQWTKEALKRTSERRGFNAALSFGAFENNELLSFTWNGTGEFNGQFTAYDTGTGTVEEHRGRGLASRIFEHSIPFLKSAGIKQYILEVLEENEAAFVCIQNKASTYPANSIAFVQIQKTGNCVPQFFRKKWS